MHPSRATTRRQTGIHHICICLTLISLWTMPFARDKIAPDYTIFTLIKTPATLIAPFLPKEYSVPLTLSGSIADEIRVVLDTMGASLTQYSEIYNKKTGFSLMITNNDYTSQARDLLSGILNPIEITNIVLTSILAYKDEETIKVLQKETTIQATPCVIHEKKMMRYTLQPTGERFRYQFRDLGAYVEESWLTSLSVVVDPSTMLAHELSLTKHTTMVTAEQQSASQPAPVNYRYIFTYTDTTPRVPVKLDLLINDALKLTIEAAYQYIDRWYLFASRTIVHYLPDSTTTSLNIVYNTYSFSNPAKSETRPVATTTYSKNLKRAAVHARKAMEALNTGHIQTARAQLQIIVSQYPGTPQAIEAQKLLADLPGGL